VDVYVLAGQSNAAGFGRRSELPKSPVDLRSPQDDVLYAFEVSGTPGRLPVYAWRRSSPSHGLPGCWTTLRAGGGNWDSGLAGATEPWFGPEITFGRTLADARREPPRRIAILKCAQGATGLDDYWRVDGGERGADHFSRLRDFALEQIRALREHGADARFRSLLWVQGESDAMEPQAAYRYKANLSALWRALAEAWDTPRLGLLGVRIGRQLWRRQAGGLPYADPVRETFESLAREQPDVACIDADDLGVLEDDIHYDSSAQQTLGVRLAEAAIWMERERDAAPAASRF